MSEIRDGETIDYGIDLGTTNSAIAVAEDGGVRVVKNNDGWDTTPSAVWIPKKDVVHVGRRAKERTEADPDDAHAEFKLEMGVAGAARTFARAGVSLTPEQLSAEVLKSLRQDAAAGLGCAPPEAAVITVPAAFALNQNNATSDAAALAGLSEHCPLVQEPTAAAIAYGVQDTSDSAYWMVFDLGGGTFDAAVMAKRDGELQLIQHAGDPYLGGKLIDWAVVDDLMVPAVRRELGLPDFTRSNRRWRRSFAKLKAEAENAKIALSRMDTFEMAFDLEGADGVPEPFEFILTRGALDDLALPFYTRAIKLCRDALAESGLRPDHIDRLLLAGGSTLSPGLRELLADPDTGPGIAVDHSQDPTTVVARGAAAFARTVRRPRKAVAAAPGEFAIELNYPAQTVDTAGIPVSGKLSSGSAVDWTRYAVVLSNPDGRPAFRGPRTVLSPDGTFYTEVTLTAGTTSRFTVELTDDSGTRQRLAGDTLAITHAKVVPGEAVLTGTLGIGRADGTFDPLLRKGTTLPAMVTKIYRTTIALHRSEPDAVIRIPLLEGERARTERNTRVGLLEIRPRDVRIDLPAESEVEVTFEIEASSREALVTAHIPLVQQQFEATINRTELLAPEHPELVDRLQGLEQRVHHLQEQAEDAYAEQARERLDTLSEHKPLVQLRREVDAAAVDTGAAVTSDRRIRDLEAQLDDIEEAIEIPGLERRLWDLLGACEDIIQQVGGSPSDRRELDNLRTRASALGTDATPADLRRLAKRAEQFQVELLRRTDQWVYLVFNALVEMRDQMYSRRQADDAILDGRRAVAAGDAEALSGVNERLRRLLPPDVADAAERKNGGVK